MTLEQIVKQSQGEQYVYPDVFTDYSYELVLKRPLTKEEIDKDPERWGDYYNEGDLTNCFKTIEDVIELAKQVFRLRFTGEWEFYVESPYNKYRGKLEINV